MIRRNGGKPGIDGVSFTDIERGGCEAFVRGIQRDLQEKSYRADPVLRVHIPKANGGERPLGIPTIKDRLVQMAVLLMVEPILEADFLDCSYGFRPGRSAHDALGDLRASVAEGWVSVYDADLRSYFDRIPHEQLMRCLKKRISDRSVLKLIRMWLQAPVVERGKGPGKSNRQGTPQGGVISPLLANLYLHWFDWMFYRSREGPGRKGVARMVRYADDFVVLMRGREPGVVNWVKETLQQRFQLQINEEKTRELDLREPGASLDFLGFTFRWDRDKRGRRWKYLNVAPSKRSLSREREKLREMTSKSQCYKPIPRLIREVNRHLLGWSNYYRFGYSRPALRHINSYVRLRLSCHLHRRSQRPFRPPSNVSLYQHLKRLGLIYL
jgi:RNA-directed DNA polymerase